MVNISTPAVRWSVNALKNNDDAFRLWDILGKLCRMGHILPRRKLPALAQMYRLQRHLLFHQTTIWSRPVMAGDSQWSWFCHLHICLCLVPYDKVSSNSVSNTNVGIRSYSIGSVCMCDWPHLTVWRQSLGHKTGQLAPVTGKSM